MRSIVTGTTGAIGRATEAELVARGHTVRGFNRAEFADIKIDEAPDVLITCHGATQDTLLGASTRDDFDKVMEANFHTAVALVREVSKHMLSARKGSIVLVSSVAAFRPGRGQSNYAASKGALESFARALAVELAPRNVRVNCVAPGVIDTPMTRQLRALAAPNEIESRILMKRLGTPEEVAKVIAFLACDASYVTGQVWSVDGGFKLA